MRWLLFPLVLGCGNPKVPDGDGVSDDSDDAATTDADSDSSTDADTATEGPTPDFRTPGPFEVTKGTGTAELAGCDMDYDTFVAKGQTQRVGLVLSHGFMRNKSHVKKWAEHLASWGFDVVTPNLCHATILDADHPQNGVDVAALAETLSPGGPVLYVGHSAGGLASLLAADQDPDAIGVFGLDLVDSGPGFNPGPDESYGWIAAPDVTVPVYGLIAQKSSCNDNNNGLAALERAPDHKVLRVEGSDHCNFEWESDLGCTALCNSGNDGHTDEEIRQTILAMMTSFVVAKAGYDPRGDEYWTPGTDWWKNLHQDGALSAP